MLRFVDNKKTIAPHVPSRTIPAGTEYRVGLNHMQAGCEAHGNHAPPLVSFRRGDAAGSNIVGGIGGGVSMPARGCTTEETRAAY